MMDILDLNLRFDGRRFVLSWAFQPDAHQVGITPTRGKRQIMLGEEVGSVSGGDRLRWFIQRVASEASTQIVLAWAILEDEENPLI